MKLIDENKIKTQGMGSNNFIISIKDYEESPSLTDKEVKCLDSNCINDCPFPKVKKFLSSKGCKKRKEIIEKFKGE